MDSWIKEVNLDSIDTPDKLVPTKDSRIPSDGKLTPQDENALQKLRADFNHKPSVEKGKRLLGLAVQLGDADAAALVMHFVDLDPSMGGLGEMRTNDKSQLEEFAEASFRNGAIRLKRHESRMNERERMMEMVLRASPGPKMPINSEITSSLETIST